jgi:hypothetical protein
LTTAVIDARASRQANEGGTVDITADTSLTIAGNINTNASGPDELSGACAGPIFAEALFGDLSVSARLDAVGSSPDGAGGCIELDAQGDVVIQSTGQISASTLGIEGCGGTVAPSAGIDYVQLGVIDVSGGATGGFVDVNATRLINVANNIDGQGRDAGAFGGTLSFVSGAGVSLGEVRVSGTINAEGGRCSFENGCGAGGPIDVSSCVVNIQPTGKLSTVAPDGEAITLTARKQMTIAGRLDATTNAPSQGSDSTITLIFPVGSPPNTTGSTITPPAILLARPLCTSLPPVGQCQIPCPTCGNGVTEFPETCDLGNPIPVNCNGCSSTCRLQNCMDDLICTRDSCDPRLGCFFPPTTTPCFEPTSTPTITHTPTITGTPTQTGTPTLTGTPTDTPLVTNTPTLSPTPVSGRPGDANCDRVINVEDRLAIERAIFQPTACPGADVNLDGAVTAADLAAFVHNSPT